MCPALLTSNPSNVLFKQWVVHQPPSIESACVLQAYCNSKLCTLLAAKHMDRLLAR